MSPLIATRAPVTVNLRLLAACGVMVLAALAVAAAGGSGRPTGAAPAGLAVGVVCAALVSHLLFACVRAVGEPRLAWLSAGAACAGVGLLTQLFGQPAVFPDGGPVTQATDAMAARYLIWHAGLTTAALLAVWGARPTRGRVVAYAVTFGALLAWASTSAAPFGSLTEASGQYEPAVKPLLAVIALVLVGCALVWWRREDGSPAWGIVCVIAALGLSAADCIAYLLASQPFDGAWWASLTLRAGQFAVPAVGLLVGFVAVGDRLRALQEELVGNLDAERERVRTQEHVARSGAVARRRIARLAAGEGVDVALQPIVDLATGRVIGAEALARFTDADGNRMPTEATFLEAYALDVGDPLELAVVRLALASDDRLPEGLYLALNVSPAVLTSDGLYELLAETTIDRPLVVELTEHQPVDDYEVLGRALDRLRALGIRVAIDDVGSGFASFRHVTRLEPEILKLDRSLVCGIDEDPVRQSLASAIAAFALELGATVVSEGIETEAELSCLRELAIACGQGFFLAHPQPGAIGEHVEQAAPVPVH